MVIAVDGPGGVGKSTISRMVAAMTGRHHLDTGAFYRAATLAVLRAGVGADDPAGVIAVVEGVDIDFAGGRALLDGVDVTEDIRSPGVTAAVSAVSAIPELRRLLVKRQRSWVDRVEGRAVVEGRDIGTVVFPQAPVKVFLTARPEIRAARRAADAEAADRDEADIASDLARRDRLDSSREASPLRPAEDAVVIDTSELGVADVLARVLELVEASEDGGRARSDQL